MYSHNVYFFVCRLGANGKSLIIETKLVVEMKTNNMIAPYEFQRVNYFTAVCCSAVIVFQWLKLAVVKRFSEACVTSLVLYKAANCLLLPITYYITITIYILPLLT